MANKREFKKNVSVLSESLCAELLFIQADNGEISGEATNREINNILSAAKKAKDRSNAFVGKYEKNADNKAKKAARRKFYSSLFKEITEDFSAAISSSLKEFNQSIPESAKERNKASN